MKMWFFGMLIVWCIGGLIEYAKHGGGALGFPFLVMASIFGGLAASLW